MLEAAGVPPVVRDRFAEERFPDDVYDLLPASLAAVDPGLREPALDLGGGQGLGPPPPPREPRIGGHRRPASAIQDSPEVH